MAVYNVYCTKHRIWVRPADLYPRHEYCEFAIQEPQLQLPQRLMRALRKLRHGKNATTTPIEDKNE